MSGKVVAGRRKSSALAWSSAALAVALVASACGQDGAAEPDVTEGTTAATSQPTEAETTLDDDATTDDGATDDAATSVAADCSVTIGEQGVAGGASGLWPRVADELGYLGDEGVTVDDYVSVTSGADAIRGHLSGDLQLSHIGADGLVAAAQGQDIIELAAMMDTSVWTVVAQPDITSWDDLEGATIALGSLNDITMVTWSAMAESAGFDPDADFEYVAAGATPDRVSAVVSGQVDATMATFPSAARVIEEQGLTDLGLSPPDADPPTLIITDLISSGQWASENEECVVGYLRALLNVQEFVEDESNREEFIDLATELMEQDRDHVEAMYDFYFGRDATDAVFLPPGLKHPEGAFERTVELYERVGILEEPVTMEDYVDYSYLDQAEAGR